MMDTNDYASAMNTFDRFVQEAVKEADSSGSFELALANLVCKVKEDPVLLENLIFGPCQSELRGALMRRGDYGGVGPGPGHHNVVSFPTPS